MPPSPAPHYRARRPAGLASASEWSFAAAGTWGFLGSVGRPVLVREPRASLECAQVDVRVEDFILARTPCADLQHQSVSIGTVLKMVSIRDACFEPGAITG